jgi:hypothetical protein
MYRRPVNSTISRLLENWNALHETTLSNTKEDFFRVVWRDFANRDYGSKAFRKT